MACFGNNDDSIAMTETGFDADVVAVADADATSLAGAATSRRGRAGGRRAGAPWEWCRR